MCLHTRILEVLLKYILIGIGCEFMMAGNHYLINIMAS